ncbi:RNA methyltransferase [Sediminibacterium sp.]|uniref:RNA methyltransferase n=1 Tax=Sediminibacterium sp. TaxID=1917865 RepID=UPI0025E84FC6|nr:RNA methyltransferase [Sediminibacterium sp.]
MRKWSMQELGRKSVADFKEAPKTPLVVVLDNIRSMHNVGSVFRTADSFLVEKMYLCGYTPQPPHRDINKTALGATETVAWEYTATTVEAVQTLQAQGYKVYAIEQAEGAIYLDQFDPLAIHSSTVQGLSGAPKIAIVMGNEVEGVADEVLDICDGCIEIPQLGSKHSLNISVAAGIIIWAITERTVLK